jgi:alkylation response protein AidB-like acyl-CoA dehydrogenase
MGLPEDAGGGGASNLDLVLVAEQYGRRIAPVPFIEAAATGHVLAAAGPGLRWPSRSRPGRNAPAATTAPGLPGKEGSAAKLFGAESAQRQHWDLLDILGSEAVLNRETGDAPLTAAVEEAFRRGVVGTICGGSSEIMREIVAERVLGLPRVRSRS